MIITNKGLSRSKAAFPIGSDSTVSAMSICQVQARYNFHKIVYIVQLFSHLLCGRPHEGAGAWFARNVSPVGGALGGVDELISQALSDGLDVPEGGLAGACGDEVDGLVDSAQGGDIHCLPPDHTCGPDSGGVFSWPTANPTSATVRPEMLQACSCL